MSIQELEREIINTFADAYQNLGYSSLMGKIVALLLIEKEPLSLDDISTRLEMSKGPISQITRRLKEHRLIERVWVPGDRRDFYRAADDIFGEAFVNYMGSMRRNRKIAEKFEQEALKEAKDAEFISERMTEMKAFYELLDEHNKKFLETWRALHPKYVRA